MLRLDLNTSLGMKSEWKSSSKHLQTLYQPMGMSRDAFLHLHVLLLFPLPHAATLLLQCNVLSGTIEAHYDKLIVTSAVPPCACRKLCVQGMSLPPISMYCPSLCVGCSLSTHPFLYLLLLHSLPPNSCSPALSYSACYE